MTADEHRRFAALLNELLAEEGEQAPIGAPRSLDYLSVAEELCSGRIRFGEHQARAEYDALQGSGRRQADPDAPAAEPSSEKPDDIARELGLSKRLDAKALDRLRRDFAARNHPDRVPAHLRANAQIRMQVANMLIDEAKRREPPRFRFGRSTRA